MSYIRRMAGTCYTGASYDFLHIGLRYISVLLFRFDENKFVWKVSVNFLLRIEKPEDAYICIENNIKYCCIDEVLSFDLNMLSLLYDNGIDIMVEMSLDNID